MECTTNWCVVLCLSCSNQLATTTFRHTCSHLLWYYKLRHSECSLFVLCSQPRSCSGVLCNIRSSEVYLMHLVVCVYVDVVCKFAIFTCMHHSPLHADLTWGIGWTSSAENLAFPTPGKELVLRIHNLYTRIQTMHYWCTFSPIISRFSP